MIFKKIKSIADEMIYIFFAYIVCNIPVWFIRKLFYCMFGMKIGKGSRILMKTVVVHPWNIVIGKNSVINEFCYIDGRGKVVIGNNVTIAMYAKLITGYHDVNSNNFGYLCDSIVVGDNVAIFAGSIVLAGVKIHDGCVFSAMSNIKRGEYEEGGIYSGNPCVFVKYREISKEFEQKPWHPWFR